MTVPSALSPFADLFQDRVLIREFEDSLLPNFLWDAVAPEADVWPAHAGLSFTITNDGYYPVVATTSPTTVDPTPVSRRAEQYDITLGSYDGTDDIDATQAQNMLADYAKQTVNRLAIQAARTIDAAARGRYVSAATAGWTVVDGAQSATTTLLVKRLNGFTTALPSSGSALRHTPVSAGNPLPVLINGVANTVIGFTAINQIPIDQGRGVDDEQGPGYLILSAAVTVADRDPVIASNASFVQRVGEGWNRQTGRIDNVNGPLSYADIRACRARFATTNVKPMRRYNNYYLAMISPTAYTQLQGDPEFQRLEQGRGVDDFPYAAGVIGYYAGHMFMENNNAPTGDTMEWYSAPNVRSPNVYGSYTRFGVANASTDPCGIETIVGTDVGRPIDHTVIFGDDVAKQYWQPHPMQARVAMLTDIGLAGVLAEPYQVSNDGVVIPIDYTALIIMSPRNRLGDKYPATWLTKRSWQIKSDQISTQGGAIRYKRLLAIESSAVG
jgi:hypothetical protein